MPGEYLADNAVDNAKKLGCLPVSLYVPLRIRVAACFVAMRLSWNSLDFVGTSWKTLEMTEGRLYFVRITCVSSESAGFRNRRAIDGGVVTWKVRGDISDGASWKTTSDADRDKTGPVVRPVYYATARCGTRFR
jgi:hypothetical protein